MLPQLPLPSELPRESSKVEPDFMTSGSNCVYFVPPQRTDTEEGKQLSNSSQFRNFEPDWEPGDSLDGLAFAAYEIRHQGIVNGSKRLRFFWSTKPVDAASDFHVALADFGRNRWVWQRGPLPGQSLDLSADYDNYCSPWGRMYLIVLFTGNDAPSLDHIMLGDSRFTFYKIANPQSAVGELQTELYAEPYVEGGFPVAYDFDFEGDGTWDVWQVHSPLQPHTYDSIGIYHPSVRVYLEEGETRIESTTVYVTDPNNIGPTALLEADVVSGDAPLTVNFDGSQSTDSGAGQIISCEWDLDGDNIFELNSGSAMTATKVFARAGINTVRMKVTDNDLASAVAVLEIDLDSGFNVSKLPGSSAPELGGLMSMCMIGSGPALRPALAYTPQGAGGQLAFVAATNANGGSWGPHYGFSEQAGPSNPSLAEISGIPAVAFSVGSSHPDGQGLRYARALDVAGSSWSESIEVFPGLRGYSDLQMVNGRPAIALSAQQQGEGVYYCRASDATGAAWGSVQQLYQCKYVSSIDAPLLLNLPGSNPLVLVSESSPPAPFQGVLWRFNALDENAAAFAEPEPLWGNATPRPSAWIKEGKVNLALHGGKPDFMGINFMRLADIHNSVLAEATVLSEERLDGYFMELAVMDGRPVIAYYIGRVVAGVQLSQVGVRIADDFAGTSWGPEIIIESEGQAGRSLQMVTTSNQKPLIVYPSDLHNELRIAVWH